MEILKDLTIPNCAKVTNYLHGALFRSVYENEYRNERVAGTTYTCHPFNAIYYLPPWRQKSNLDIYNSSAWPAPAIEGV